LQDILKQSHCLSLWGCRDGTLSEGDNPRQQGFIVSQAVTFVWHFIRHKSRNSTPVAYLSILIRYNGSIWRQMPEQSFRATRERLQPAALPRTSKSRLRPLQARLAVAGLSSLGRAESHALGAVRAVLRVLYRLDGRSIPAAELIAGDIDLAEGPRCRDHGDDAERSG
jgi:hypothetical protein